jgi:hypothetical protein
MQSGDTLFVGAEMRVASECSDRTFGRVYVYNSNFHFERSQVKISTFITISLTEYFADFFSVSRQMLIYRDYLK